MSVELAGLGGQRVDAGEAAVRIARLTQEYADVLADFSRQVLGQVDRQSRDRKSPARRRQGRVID